jgi:hypothetical protein
VHWYLVSPDGYVWDVTALQFETLPDYDAGRGRGFLTRYPSKRAQILIDRFMQAGLVEQRCSCYGPDGKVLT